MILKRGDQPQPIELMEISNVSTSRRVENEHQQPIQLVQPPIINNQRIHSNEQQEQLHDQVRHDVELLQRNNNGGFANNVPPNNGGNNQMGNNRGNGNRPVQNQNNGLLSSVLNKTKIMVVLMVVCILVFFGWLGTKYSLQNFTKSRKPMFLSNFDFSNPPQVISPQETDYIAYKYYKKAMQFGKEITQESRELKPSEMAQFNNIIFKEFYILFKVIRTIQLTKEFIKDQQQEEELDPIVYDPTNLDVAVNKTEYLADAVDQFQCASCYSFPIAATIEYLYKYKYNISVKLSQQQLIDCAHDSDQPNGCNNGNITKGFEYARDVGLVSTIEYPYRSITGKSFKCNQEIIDSNKKYKISGFKFLPPGNCQAIQAELIKGNVVAAMINAGELPKYVDGTFTDCKRTGFNHAITIVGQTEKNEWIVRNSWGKSWGNNGYFTMGHGNTCGVCSHAIVPILNIQNGQVKPYDPKQDQQAKEKKDS